MSRHGQYVITSATKPGDCDMEPGWERTIIQCLVYLTMGADALVIVGYIYVIAKIASTKFQVILFLVSQVLCAFITCKSPASTPHYHSTLLHANFAANDNLAQYSIS